MLVAVFLVSVMLGQPADVPPELPVVVLVGDSIRLGYAPVVADLLKGKARVVSVEANGGDSANVLAHLDDWAIDPKPAVVHLNAGLHDLKRDPKTGAYPVDVSRYEANIRRILERLERETSARLIVATTTPVLDDRHNAVKPFQRAESDVERYNGVLKKVAAASDVTAVDDLHAVATKLGLETALLADGVHFTKEAYQALGAQVARQIEAALDEPFVQREVVCVRVDRPPVLDGVADEEFWRHAPRIEAFPAFWNGTPTDLRTVAWLVWDDDALYYAAVMADDELFAAGAKRNDRLWEGDVFELFFKPADDRPEYFEFQVNPRGVILELPFPKRGAPFDELAQGPPLGMTVGVQAIRTINVRDDDVRWSVEGKIPWSAFAPVAQRPEPGTTWRFALCRYDYSDDGTDPVLMSTAPLRRKSFHRYEDYGRLRFVGADR